MVIAVFELTLTALVLLIKFIDRFGMRVYGSCPCDRVTINLLVESRSKGFHLFLCLCTFQVRFGSLFLIQLYFECLDDFSMVLQFFDDTLEPINSVSEQETRCLIYSDCLLFNLVGLVKRLDNSVIVGRYFL